MAQGKSVQNTPQAVDDRSAAQENGSTVIDVLANDRGGAAKTLFSVSQGTPSAAASSATLPGGSSISIVDGRIAYSSNGKFDYLAAGETAWDVFTYSIKLGAGAVSVGTVQVLVTGTNDAAVLSSAVVEVTEGDNAADISTSGLLTVSDVDGPDSFQAATVAGQYGSFFIEESGAWTYTANGAHDEFEDGAVYSDTFTARSADGTETSVKINITGTNDGGPPVAEDDSFGTTGSLTLNAANGVLSNDSDEDGFGSGAGQAFVSAYDAQSAKGGSVVMNPDGSFSYVPKVGFLGLDSFTYTLTDSTGASDQATVTLEVIKPFRPVKYATATNATVAEGSDLAAIYNSTLVDDLYSRPYDISVGFQSYIYDATPYLEEYRAFMEFNLTGIDHVTDMTVKFRVDYIRSPGGAAIDVFAYAGDGKIDESDWGQGVLAGTATLEQSDVGPGVRYVLHLDAEVVNDVLMSSNYLGLVFVSDEPLPLGSEDFIWNGFDIYPQTILLDAQFG